MEYNLPIKKIEEAVFYQFKHVTNVMKRGEFEGIRLPYLGRFHVNPNRIKHIEKNKNEGARNNK